MQFELYSLISSEMIAYSVLFDFPLEEIRMGALTARFLDCWATMQKVRHHSACIFCNISENQRRCASRQCYPSNHANRLNRPNFG